MIQFFSGLAFGLIVLVLVLIWCLMRTQKINDSLADRLMSRDFGDYQAVTEEREMMPEEPEPIEEEEEEMDIRPPLADIDAQVASAESRWL